MKLVECKPVMYKKRDLDLAWVVGSINFVSNYKGNEANLKSNGNNVGTWGAFNSLINEPVNEVTNIALLAPLIRSPPTDINTLFTAIMRTKNVTTKVWGGSKITVVTFELQLYNVAMQLWEDDVNIRRQFIIRPEELHVVFWALAALGKYIEGSGIDQAWVEAGLYSPSTITKILQGKQLYRAMEAHTVTLLTFYQLYFDKFLKDYPEDEAVISIAVRELRQSYMKSINNDGTNHLNNSLNNLTSLFESCNLQKKMNQFQGSMTKQQKFITSYLKQFETILSYVRATRERNFLLHLETTEELIKYSFAHDHLNYARLLPLYLSCMQNAKLDHPEIWLEFMKGNFCVSKSLTPFTSIAPDHALEQENRSLK